MDQVLSQNDQWSSQTFVCYGWVHLPANPFLPQARPTGLFGLAHPHASILTSVGRCVPSLGPTPSLVLERWREGIFTPSVWAPPPATIQGNAGDALDSRCILRLPCCPPYWLWPGICSAFTTSVNASLQLGLTTAFTGGGAPLTVPTRVPTTSGLGSHMAEMPGSWMVLCSNQLSLSLWDDGLCSQRGPPPPCSLAQSVRHQAPGSLRTIRGGQWLIH